jgi:NAD-dependent SIR2 family protein deacetylase
MDLDKNIRKAAQILQDSEAVLITAGAGIGVDSGLPDFRGNEGFWRAYPPIAKLGISFSQMANPQWFFRDPQLAWGFYGHRLNLYRNTTPHEGFTRLLEIVRRKKGRYFVFTSNVDGQFQKAGYSGERIEECHGSIHHLQCARPCGNDIWDAGKIIVSVDEETFRAKNPLPVCRNCGELARPNVLMFGDWHWVSERTEAQSRRLNEWLGSIQQQGLTPAVVEIGAGEAVPTVRHTSEHVASRLEGMLIRINPRDARVPAGHITISLNGKEAINRMIQTME